MIVVVSLFWTTSAFLYGSLLKLFGTKDISRRIHSMAIRWAKSIIFLTPGWKVRVEGCENLPRKDQACVFVANHESATDIFVTYYIGSQFRWLSKAEVFKVPMIGLSMKWAGYVGIKRGQKQSHIKALEESAEWLKKGIPMLFFPEGTRSETGELRPFKIGAFKLADEQNVTVVPIVLHGTRHLLKKHSATPGTANVTVKILPAMRRRGDETYETFASRTRQLIIDAHKALD